MNQNDDFMELLDEQVKEQIDITPFEINNIKLTHFYFNSGDLDVGSPLETSLELNCKYNFESEKLEWTKTITHIYYNLDDEYKKEADSFLTELNDCDSLISELNKIDLRQLKNNYFTDEDPERFTHWEISYNYYFKIAGTYDRELAEVKKISELLDFKQMIKEKYKKINNKTLEN